MSDLFHDDVPDEFIARIWWVMGQCAGYLDPSRYRGHTFFVLTKRPKRMKEWLEGWADGETRKHWIESFGAVYDWMSGPKYWPDVLPNVWLGVTAENQQRADERIPILLQIPAAVRFVSVEPMLGPVDLQHLQFGGEIEIDCLNGTHGVCRPHGGTSAKLDWVICGGETGYRARPMHPDWARDLRDQCVRARVPFFFKGWGDWAITQESDDPECDLTKLHENEKVMKSGNGWVAMSKVGKKRAGSLLDGQ